MLIYMENKIELVKNFKTNKQKKRVKYMLIKYLVIYTLQAEDQIFQYSIFAIWYFILIFLLLIVCVCVCVFVCVYSLPFWRLLRTVRQLWHTWGVRINKVMLWVLFLELLQSPFIAFYENVIFHLQRWKLQLTINWSENDMI